MEEKDALILELQSKLAKLEIFIIKLEAVIVDLTEQLGQKAVKKTSANSSMAPSHDLARKNQNRRKKSDKKSGGQVGHEATTLTFNGTPDIVEDNKPNFCNHCGNEFDVSELQLERTTHEIDIEIKRKVTATRHFKAKCSCCGVVHKPDFVPPVRYGPTINALVGYLSVVHFVSFKRIASFLSDVTLTPISQGTVDTILKKMGIAIQKAVAFIKEEIQKAKVVGADETSSKENGKKGWFWVFQSPKYTLMIYDKSRSKSVLTHHFPEGLPNAILVSDRYGAYLNFESKGKQYCLAHLLRDAKYLKDLEKTTWATQFITWIEDAFDNKLAPDLPTRLDELLKETLTCGTPKTRSFLKSMQKIKEGLTTFLYHKDVPLDNNASERAIRNIKSKTKIACQFKTEKGACIYANIRSVMDTACKNGSSNWKAFLQIAQNYLQIAT